MGQPYNLESIIIRTALDLLLSHHEMGTIPFNNSKLEPQFLCKVTEINVFHWHSWLSLPCMCRPTQPCWKYFLVETALKHPLHPTERTQAQSSLHECTPSFQKGERKVCATFAFCWKQEGNGASPWGGEKTAWFCCLYRDDTSYWLTTKP